MKRLDLVFMLQVQTILLFGLKECVLSVKEISTCGVVVSVSYQYKKTICWSNTKQISSSTSSHKK